MKDAGMDSEELLGQVRALRGKGYSPKRIARALGVPPATVVPLVQAIAAERQADVAEGEVVGCWISPGWSQGLTVNGHPEWPDVDAADAGPQGLVSVLVERHQHRGKVAVCGWLVDVWCLGVKDVVGPRNLDSRRAAELRDSFFAAYRARPLQAPVELAQHLVFGAVEYARSLGLAPARGFAATTGHLGPWAGPSAIGFGRDGKPYFIQGPHDDATKVIKTLEDSVGRDNFHFLVLA